MCQHRSNIGHYIFFFLPLWLLGSCFEMKGDCCASLSAVERVAMRGGAKNGNKVPKMGIFRRIISLSRHQLYILLAEI